MKTGKYRNYLLTVLLFILAFNFVDRLALGLVQDEVRRDLKLTDTEFGFLGGVAFALFYSVMGVPIARWADRGNRVTVISITTLLWSAAVVLCGATRTFTQLIFARVAVAVGEAGCIPSAHSLIADAFSRAERARAVARYTLGGPLSLVIGYFLAGWLNQLYGWRTMFMVLGIPGVCLAGLAWLSLREPRSAWQGNNPSSVLPLSPREGGLTPDESPRLKEVCMTLWSNLTFRHLLFGFSVIYFFGYGILQWQPAFLIRSFGFKTGELGTWLAIINGSGGLLGTYLGGELASRGASNNERAQLIGMVIVYCSLAVLSIGVYISTNYLVSFILMGIAAVANNATNGPMLATIQTLIPPRMRATSIAVIFLFANLIGMGLGPLAVGVMSDALRPFSGEESLRYALLALCPGYLWAGWHLWRAAKTVTTDLAVV